MTVIPLFYSKQTESAQVDRRSGVRRYLENPINKSYFVTPSSYFDSMTNRVC